MLNFRWIISVPRPSARPAYLNNRCCLRGRPTLCAISMRPGLHTTHLETVKQPPSALLSLGSYPVPSENQRPSCPTFSSRSPKSLPPEWPRSHGNRSPATTAQKAHIPCLHTSQPLQAPNWVPYPSPLAVASSFTPLASQSKHSPILFYSCSPLPTPLLHIFPGPTGHWPGY